MRNPMDNLPLQQVQQRQNDCPVIPGMSNEMCNAFQMGRQNPQWLEEQAKLRNPQGYDEIMRIRNSPNPQQAARQMLQNKGVPPYIMRMFGL